MYFTRHFAHHDSLTRAHRWLTQLGFKPHQIETHKHGTPRITLSIHPQQWAEVSLLLGAVERTDPAGTGRPSFWEYPRPGQRSSDADQSANAPSTRRVHTAAIGWHPLD
jgi:hypothetical protein